jgi:hypothetical protein
MHSDAGKANGEWILGVDWDRCDTRKFDNDVLSPPALEARKQGCERDYLE